MPHLQLRLRLFRLARRLRGRRAIGLLVAALLLSVAIVGNATCFIVFEGPTHPELSWADALWYSVISISDDRLR